MNVDPDIHLRLLELRSMKDFAAICQFLHFFHGVFAMEDFETEVIHPAPQNIGTCSRNWSGAQAQLLERLITSSPSFHASDASFKNDLEQALVDPSQMPFLIDLHARMLRQLTQEKRISFDNWIPYAQKEFEKREDERNPWLDTDEASSFEDFSLATKLLILTNLCEWQLDDPERFRAKLKQEEEVALDMRVEPIGYDAHERTYWFFDDNRVYRENPQPKKNTRKPKPSMPPPPKPKAAPEPRRGTRRSGRHNLEASPEPEPEPEHETPPITPGVEWEPVCITRQDWEEFANIFKRSKHPDEKALHTYINQVLPEVLEVFKEKLAQQHIRDNRLKEREQRLKDREEAVWERAEKKKKEQERIAKEREARKQRRLNGSPSKGADHSEDEQAKNEDDEQEEEGDWFFDCVCGVHGQNLDDGELMIACEKCNVWQHVACLKEEDMAQGGKVKDWKALQFTCPRCILKEQKKIARKAKKEQKLKMEALAAAANGNLASHVQLKKDPLSQVNQEQHGSRPAPGTGSVNYSAQNVFAPPQAQSTMNGLYNTNHLHQQQQPHQQYHHQHQSPPLPPIPRPQTYTSSAPSHYPGQVYQQQQPYGGPSPFGSNPSVNNLPTPTYHNGHFNQGLAPSQVPSQYGYPSHQQQQQQQQQRPVYFEPQGQQQRQQQQPHQQSQYPPQGASGTPYRPNGMTASSTSYVNVPSSSVTQGTMHSSPQQIHAVQSQSVQSHAVHTLQQQRPPVYSLPQQQHHGGYGAQTAVNAVPYPTPISPVPVQQVATPTISTNGSGVTPQKRIHPEGGMEGIERPSKLPSQKTTLSQRAQQNLTGENIMLEGVVKVNANKYDAQSNPDGIINLGVAENQLMKTDLIEIMGTVNHVDPKLFGYGESPSGSKLLRRHFAENIFNRYFNPQEPVQVDHIILSAGCSSTVDNFTFCVCDEGEGILITTPFYGGFNTDIATKSKAKVVVCDLGDLSPFDPMHLELLQGAVDRAQSQGIRVKAMVLANPHNPLGRNYPLEILVAYLRFASQNRIHILFDEIYALSTFDHALTGEARAEQPDHNPFISVLSIPHLEQYCEKELIHMAYGMSKDFCLNGFRCGALVSPWNEDMILAMRSIAVFTWISSTTEAMLTKLLSDPLTIDRFTSTNQKRLAESYSFAVDLLRKHKIPFIPAQGGHFLWIDLRQFIPPSFRVAAQSGDRHAEYLLWRAMLKEGVYVNLGEAFTERKVGFFRLTFSVPIWMLDLGLKRMLRALQLTYDPLRVGTVVVPSSTVAVESPAIATAPTVAPVLSSDDDYSDS
ncbi:hypothetical protein BGZ83_003256 [Gryganskiella cystojenkinii]|nr:hypothetical protein BGZ83_003256 [Gryganskiella cystojenkinii]